MIPPLFGHRQVGPETYQAHLDRDTLWSLAPEQPTTPAHLWAWRGREGQEAIADAARRDCERYARNMDVCNLTQEEIDAIRAEDPSEPILSYVGDIRRLEDDLPRHDRVSLLGDFQ